MLKRRDLDKLGRSILIRSAHDLLSSLSRASGTEAIEAAAQALARVRPVQSEKILLDGMEPSAVMLNVSKSLVLWYQDMKKNGTTSDTRPLDPTSVPQHVEGPISCSDAIRI